MIENEEFTIEIIEDLELHIEELLWQSDSIIKDHRLSFNSREIEMIKRFSNEINSYNIGLKSIIKRRRNNKSFK